MWFRNCFLLRSIIIFFTYQKLGFANPMVGANVRQAMDGEFPSVVALKRITQRLVHVENARFCSGTLITSIHVLTAAHCLENRLLRDIEIIVGTIDIRSGIHHFPEWAIDYNQWAKCSERYRKLRVNDIVIIKLTRAVSAGIVPAELNLLPNDQLYGLTVVAAGWGVTNNGSNPRYLETVELTVLSRAECIQKIEFASQSKLELPLKLLCSYADPYALLINGDSGCPIFVDNVIVGVHKSTVPFPEIAVHPNKVNIHSSVADYRDFITNIIGES